MAIPADQPESDVLLVEMPCGDEDPELFFFAERQRSRSREMQLRVARAVCARCIVRKDCLMGAVERDESYGIWGGASERELHILAAKYKDNPRNKLA